MRCTTLSLLAVLAISWSWACEDERLVPGATTPTRRDASAPADAGAELARTDGALPEAADAAAALDAKLFEDALPALDVVALADAEVARVDAGTPDGGEATATPGILVADPVGNQIFHLGPTGAVVRVYASPIAAVSAVTLDRRARDGFWIGGSGIQNPLFTKLDWAGNVVDTRDYAADRLFQFTEGGVRAMDYGVGGSLAEDSLPFLFTNNNQVDVVAVGYAGMVGWSGETGIGLRLGYEGVSLIHVTVGAPATLEYWSASAGRIERWAWAANTPTAVVATGLDIRGVEAAPDGTFWVTDRATLSVVHVDGAGARLGAVPVPGRAVADLSLIE